MQPPLNQAYCVGEVTPWGEQFLKSLRDENLFEVHFENIDSLCTPPPLNECVVVFVENGADSRNTLYRLRQSGRFAFLVWFGKSFSKEEISYAMEMRVYAVLENLCANDKKLVGRLSKLILVLDSNRKILQLLHHLKIGVLESENSSSDPLLLSEMKAAVTKLMEYQGQSDFASVASLKQLPENRLPFYSTQDMGDALMSLQSFERTGVLEIRGGRASEQGQVSFLQGKIIEAKVGTVSGLKAIYRMFLWNHPTFTFMRKNSQSFDLENPIPFNMETICAVGSALKGRFSKIAKDIPPSTLRLELDPKAFRGDTGLSREDFNTLASVVEFSLVSEIIDYNNQPDVILFESLVQLRRARMIRVAESR